MENINWNSEEQRKGRKLAFILCLCIFAFAYIWITIERARVDGKLTECSRYTVGKVIGTKRWRFQTLLIYSFVLNGKIVQATDRPDPSSLSEWLNIDYNRMLGRRLWIQAYCDDPNFHKRIWDIEVPETIKVIPEKGWNALPIL